MKRIGFLFALSLFAGQLPAQQQYCVENDITHAYLNDFTYDTVSLDKSFVMKYFNMPHDYRLDAPRPVELTWTHQDGAESQTVEVSESADFTNAIVFALDKDTARYELYNLAPGRKYYYRIVSVKSGTQTTVGSGQLEPTGMLRWVYAQGTWNVRDMGGWTGLNGYRIKEACRRLMDTTNYGNYTIDTGNNFRRKNADQCRKAVGLEDYGNGKRRKLR